MPDSQLVWKRVSSAGSTGDAVAVSPPPVTLDCADDGPQELKSCLLLLSETRPKRYAVSSTGLDEGAGPRKEKMRLELKT